MKRVRLPTELSNLSSTLYMRRAKAENSVLDSFSAFWSAPHFLDFLSVELNVRLSSFVYRANNAGKLWKAFSKLSKMKGSSFLYVSLFKSYTL